MESTQRGDFTLSREDGETIRVRIWCPKESPKGIVQLVHGMAEHIDRYSEAACRMAENGWLVAGHNHRGHGVETEDAALGYFADSDGWNKLIEDIWLVSQSLKERYPSLPLILMGHSMGSFAAREYALRHGDALAALILSGTGYYGKAMCNAGIAAATLSSAKKPAKLVDKLAFSSNNKPFAPNRTSCDWLSRDEKKVDEYIADPRCGFLFTGKAYQDFFQGLKALTDEDRLFAMPKKLPVYLMSGACDPVGQMGNGVKKVASLLRKAGMQDITVQLYEGGRHEMLNEVNREQVIDDLLNWMNSRVKLKEGA